jgi:DNA-binding transcriptional MerR regulator/effector-binding domain-containing protein
MKEYYTVGEIGKLFKVSTDTLRYYDDINLLKPWMTGKNGYRYYSKAQFEMISTILLLRSIGTPINKLFTILKYKDASRIEAELLSYTDEIDKKISELQGLKAQAVLLCTNLKDTCYDEKIIVRQLPQFWILSKEFGTDNDELDINEIVGANCSTKENWRSFANIISTIDKHNLLEGDYHTYKDYGYISEYSCETDRKDLLKIIESRLYVCCNAKVTRIDHIDIDRIYDKMLIFIKQNGYQVTGDAIERNVLDLYNGKEKDMILFFKIYIPVTKIGWM